MSHELVWQPGGSSEIPAYTGFKPFGHQPVAYIDVYNRAVDTANSEQDDSILGVVTGYTPTLAERQAALAISDSYNTVYHQNLQSKLQPFRDFFDVLQPWQVEVLGSEMRRLDVPEALRPADEHTDWKTHIVGLPDDDFVEYLRWNGDHNQAQNANPSWQHLQQGYRQVYQAAVEMAVDQADLPDVALDIIPKVDKVPAAIGDVFVTAIRGYGGYYNNTQGIVVENPRSQDTFFHEMGHAVVPNFAYPPLIEGMNEHVAQGLQSGDFASIHPDTRDRPGVYQNQRGSLNAIAYSGVHKVEPRVLAGSCFDPEIAREMTSQSYKAFPGVDIWSYHHTKSHDVHRDFHASELHQQYGLPPIRIKEELEAYPKVCIESLGFLKRGGSVSQMQGALDERLETLRDEQRRWNVSTHDSQPYCSLELKTWVQQKVADDFRAGTAFLGY